MAPVALIIGITGQDGSYLADFLFEKGYEVHGIIRRSSSFNTYRVEHFRNLKNSSGKGVTLHYGDVTDLVSLLAVIKHIGKVDELYNLAAQSHVKVSFEEPIYTASADAVGVLNVLEAVRLSGMTKTCKVYQASTSEMFGKVAEPRQSETTPFYPRSPYGCSKLAAHWYVINYREAYGMFACCGILFNHESPRRLPTFVTRKITKTVAQMVEAEKEGKEKPVLVLGNLDAKRDWGHSKDYTVAMWMMLQQEQPDEFVIGTGKTYTVRYFIEKCFDHVGKKIIWEGEGVDEVGKDSETKETLVTIDPKYFRPTEVDLLCANPAKAKELLKWEATVTLDELITEMMNFDLLNPSAVN